MFQKVKSLLIVVIALYDVVNSSKGNLVSKRASFTNPELLSITTYIDARINNDEGCQNVVRNLASLYGSRDVDVVRLNLAELSFQDFCRQNCGQVILDAWKSCDAYNDIEPAANLLIGMCASYNGSTCLHRLQGAIYACGGCWVQVYR